MKKRLIIVTIVTLITLIIAGVILYTYKKGKASTPDVPEVVITNNIDKYGYILTDNDTEYYKTLFDKLKNLLENETIDEELYTSLVSQLFLTDFYNLDNKLSSSDIGGTQYVYESYRDNFALKAKDTMYKSIKSNLYDDRDQKLPVVTKVSIDSIVKDKYKFENNEVDAFNVKCEITYEEDLGYPTTVKLVLIHNGDKLEVAKMA